MKKFDVLAIVLLGVVTVIAILLNLIITYAIVKFLAITNEGAIATIHTVIGLFEFLALFDLVND